MCKICSKKLKVLLRLLSSTTATFSTIPCTVIANCTQRCIFPISTSVNHLIFRFAGYWARLYSAKPKYIHTWRLLRIWDHVLVVCVRLSIFGEMREKEMFPSFDVGDLLPDDAQVKHIRNIAHLSGAHHVSILQSTSAASDAPLSKQAGRADSMMSGSHVKLTADEEAAVPQKLSSSSSSSSSSSTVTVARKLDFHN